MLLNWLMRKKKLPHERSAPSSPDEPLTRISGNLADTVTWIQATLGNPSDLIIRSFTIGDSGRECVVVCIDGLVNKDLVNVQIMENLQLRLSAADVQLPADAEALAGKLEREVLSTHELNKKVHLEDIIAAILSGDTAILIDGAREALIVGTSGWASRGIEEPETETLVRGPREGFAESLRTNLSLIRKNLRDPHLRFHSLTVGRRSRRQLVIAYVEGIIHPQLVAEAKRRLQSLDMDDPQESGEIEQWIEDSFLSPFPQILHTERPDKVFSSLLQGRLAILLDGTPFVLIAPLTFVSLFQSPEDYYERWLIGSLTRLLRYVAAAVSLFTPSLYIALVSFHQGMLPSKLAFSIAAAREGLPFPAAVEAFLMEATIELLREAGLRLPKPVGQTIGVVGGLVIGEAAVKAGIVSPTMVIVVSLTAIASFTIPSYSAGITFRILRFGMMLASGVFGLFGMVLYFIMICVHLANLKSLGIPYTAPLSVSFKDDWKDMLIRAPIAMLKKRPIIMETNNETRMNKEGNGT
ncbi:spore germination protein [Paenibacillus thalictri]|uniref:Spore germination protein n=1 Tax=Paenibacillus thalictri TaxID=2527873 RepID=A0A4Q9DYE3_9BACL|nr:spore germination protein [Paenibacillus thalictri]TBL81120.1 spore germination protein [Paenibacillus thalictri]